MEQSVDIKVGRKLHDMQIVGADCESAKHVTIRVILHQVNTCILIQCTAVPVIK